MPSVVDMDILKPGLNDFCESPPAVHLGPLTCKFDVALYNVALYKLTASEPSAQSVSGTSPTFALSPVILIKPGLR